MVYEYLLECGSKKSFDSLEESLDIYGSRSINNFKSPYRTVGQQDLKIIYKEFIWREKKVLSLFGEEKLSARIISNEKISEEFFDENWKIKEINEVYRVRYSLGIIEKDHHYSEDYHPSYFEELFDLFKDNSNGIKFSYDVTFSKNRFPNVGYFYYNYMPLIYFSTHGLAEDVIELHCHLQKKLQENPKIEKRWNLINHNFDFN